jgi:hypothetical protein
MVRDCLKLDKQYFMDSFRTFPFDKLMSRRFP